jgi:hypothetical protein
MERFAEAVKLAAKIREDSFDHKKADEMERSKDLSKNFDSCYTKTIYKAADMAAEELGFDQRATEPIYLLLKYTWNDILYWAEKSLKVRRK